LEEIKMLKISKEKKRSCNFSKSLRMKIFASKVEQIGQAKVI